MRKACLTLANTEGNFGLQMLANTTIFQKF